MLAGRSCKKPRALIDGLAADGHDTGALTPVICDLADLDSVAVAVQEINKILRMKPLDILVENAGIMPTKYSETPQGHEISFGTNVLGHFALRAGLLRGCLSEKARVIILTGDIYVFSDGCSSDFRWRTPLGGIKAYNRSKLGNFWVARELRRRYPRLNVFIVHPGVVATNLGAGGAVAKAMKRRLLIDPIAGAQTSLICATQPDLAYGSYYHNVYGEVELTNADPAMNDWKPASFGMPALACPKEKRRKSAPCAALPDLRLWPISASFRARVLAGSHHPFSHTLGRISGAVFWRISCQRTRQQTLNGSGTCSA